MSLLRRTAIDAYRWTTMPYRCWTNWREKSRNQVPIGILFYHRVADHSPTPWSMSRRCFETQIQWLRKRFDLIGLDEAQRRMREGNDRPAVCVTFDDGYEENNDFALPLLADLQIPTMYFVSWDFVLQQRPFPHDLELGLQLPPNRIETLRKWVGTSIEFGGHTRTHRDLGQVHDLAQLWDETVVAGEELAAALGCPVRHFAFPYGQPQHLSGEAIELARLAGLKSVSLACGGWNHVGQPDFCLHRIHGDPCLSRFKNWLSGDPRHRSPQCVTPKLTPERLAATTEFWNQTTHASSGSNTTANPTSPPVTLNLTPPAPSTASFG